MRLYTICIDQRPVLIMSAGVVPPMPDSLKTDAELVKAHRERRAMLERRPDEVRRTTERREIAEALNTWLGVELRSLTHDGAPLWSGDRASLEVREARADEVQRWHASRQHTAETGDPDTGEEDGLVFLVSVSKVDEEGWC